MNRNRAIVIVMLMLALAAGVEASALLVTCEVGGATLERYNDNTHRFERVGGMPYLITVPRYTYVMIRVTTPGYQRFEQGYEVRSDGTTRAHVVLEPENDNPTSTSLFSIGGQVTRKSGMSILRGQYTMMARNMTTYRTGTGQMAHDENPIEADGWYTCTWADLANNRAAAVGDRVFVGVMTLDRRRFLGYNYVTLTEENLQRGYVLINISIK